MGKRDLKFWAIVTAVLLLFVAALFLQGSGSYRQETGETVTLSDHVDGVDRIYIDLAKYGEFQFTTGRDLDLELKHRTDPLKLREGAAYHFKLRKVTVYRNYSYGGEEKLGQYWAILEAEKIQSSPWPAGD